MYNQDKVALVASVVEGHMRPGEFLTAIISKSLFVEPFHLRLQKDQAARETAFPYGDVFSGQLRDKIDQVVGYSLWGTFNITFTRTSLKKQWVKLKRGEHEYFER